MAQDAGAVDDAEEEAHEEGHHALVAHVEQPLHGTQESVGVVEDFGGPQEFDGDDEGGRDDGYLGGRNDRADDDLG